MKTDSKVTTITPTPAPLKRVLLVLLGAVIFSLNMNAFVNSGRLIPGGFSGITLVIQRAVEKWAGFHIPFTALYWSLNAIPVYISFRYIGIKFTLYSLLMIAVSSLLTDFIPVLNFTSEPIDPLLCAVFGGIINGVAISLCLRADATSGGTDFIAIFFSQRKGVDMWNYIFIMNVVVLVAAGFLFGFEDALYSIVFQFSSTQVLNVLYRHYQKVTLLIVTDKPDELYEIIRDETHHAATKLTATGCYGGKDKTMLYTVVSSDQLSHLSKALKKCDENAFINVMKTKEIYGRFFTSVKD
ncbi:MAG: YitT family protein [Treponema sp.]|nr:YitT family protein [Treponema sp.]